MFSMHTEKKTNKIFSLTPANIFDNMKTLDDILNSGLKIDEKDLKLLLFPEEKNLELNNNEQSNTEKL